jgi:hypothetical protein
VTTIAADNDKRRELDADTRRAWGDYTDRVRDLTGEEYERAEDASWEQLQRELDELDRRRKSLTSDAG